MIIFLIFNTFFIKIILGVLWISILWEVFEVILNNNTTLFPFNTLDTFSDICFDLSGGATALLYFSKRIISSVSLQFHEHLYGSFYHNPLGRLQSCMRAILWRGHVAR